MSNKSESLLTYVLPTGSIKFDLNCIGGVMVNMLASSVVDCEFWPWLGQIKDYTIGIYYFSAKHAAFKE